ncbi:MAG: MMPL family transporter, partial [Pontiellaceae bacterium]|nr:MMPL family transporter [Pontiellaceae bacterium]
DGKTIGILLVLRSDQPREERMALLNKLQAEAPEKLEGTVHVVGLPILKAAVADHIARDQRVVTPLSAVVMMIILGLLFHRMAGVALPMLIVGLSMVTTLGLYAACGFELNSITSLLPPVVIVLSVSVAVHLLDAWNHAIDTGGHGPKAIRSAIQSVWKPCVFTAAMTAVGLLSLVLSPIPAVRLFGLFASIGVSLSVVYAFAILPIALGWIKERPARSRPRWMERILIALAELPARHPAAVLAGAGLITVASSFATARIENNTDLIHFFKHHDPVFINHDNVGSTLGSVRSLDLLARKFDGSAFDPMVDLPALSHFTEKIETIPDVVGTSSIADYALLMSDPSAAAPEALPSRLLADDGRLVRIQVLLGDIGSSRASAISAQINEIEETALGAGWEVNPTGAYWQVVRDSNKLVATLLKSFGITLAVVLISTALLFRTPKVLIPAFIPNILPIIWGAGLMGLLGIDLSTATTMVAAVVIGLAVDDTIHYLHHYQSYRHLPAGEATRATTRRIGRALVVSSIVLVGGFWMGAFGSFIPTNTFALLTGGMMASALLCDLLVLPSYLVIAHSDRRKSS